ncbi:MAG: phosphonate ABC transporter ATP-binding protein [Akkermansiaceae bacterium]
MAKLFQLRNLTKRFGSIPAIDDVNIDIEQGEIIALIGSSGSGKTTLLKLLNAQHLADDGEVLLASESIKSLNSKQLRQARSKIAFIPQDLGIVSNLKVFQNIFLGKVGLISTVSMLWRFLFPPKSELLKVHELLERTGISEKLYSITSTLSGGQQQRVAVARSLYQGAHTILADEPISAVDPARARSLIMLLIEISRENNLTLIMSIHNIELAQEFFPRLIGLKLGKVLFDKTEVSPTDLANLYQLSEEQLAQ